MQDILYIFTLSLGSIIALLILTKLMGYRQLSQMSMFDYVNGITIGSIAAEMSTAIDDDFWRPLTAMIVYALSALLISFVSSKSIRARRFFSGKSLILLNHGELYMTNLKKAKIDVNEFLTQARISGYYDISKLESAILEENGKISFLPQSKERPITPGDLNINPTAEHMVANVIIDGNIMTENLHHTGNSETWLMHMLKANGANNISDVLLATCDYENKVHVYLKKVKKIPPDVFI